VEVRKLDELNTYVAYEDLVPDLLYTVDGHVFMCVGGRALPEGKWCLRLSTGMVHPILRHERAIHRVKISGYFQETV